MLPAFFTADIVGAIHGSHFEITPPSDGMAECRKIYSSMVLQAGVDAQYLFDDTYCNMPGGACEVPVF